VVSGNMIDGAANGISIANFDKGGRLASVTGNVVRNLTLKGPYQHELGFGIGIAAEADTLVSGNVIEGAPRWGMQLGWGPYLRNLVVTGNVIRKAPIGCASRSSMAPALPSSPTTCSRRPRRRRSRLPGTRRCRASWRPARARLSAADGRAQPGFVRIGRVHFLAGSSKALIDP
jgi:putative cofactor-binding repeat protein